MPNVTIPFIVMSAICGAISIIAPIFVPRGPNSGVIRVMLVTTGICLYMFWVCAILCQMNPLLGPQLKKEVAFIVKQEWPAH